MKDWFAKGINLAKSAPGAFALGAALGWFVFKVLGL